MHPLVSEGLSLVLRWAHLIAGIMWIGSSIFFHWLDSHMEKVADEKRPGLEGVLWMVHSGGFYEVEKKLVAPSALPKTLHWFKWEAAFTWLTGFFLLVLLYHLGGGVLLVDERSPVSAPIATAICLGTLVVAWFAYDLLWTSKLAGTAPQNPPLAIVLSVVGLAAIALVLSHFVTGRAAYIHTAAVMGTCMVLNVWVRIIPAQRNLVESVKAGVPANAVLAYGAKRRSKHNHYLTYPVLFIMISNHFPSTYGSSATVALGDVNIGWSWIILVGLCAAGALVKWWMNKADPSANVLLTALGVAVVVAALGTAAGSLRTHAGDGADAGTSAAAGIAHPGAPIALTGRIVGTVSWTGALPPEREVTLYGGCEQGHDGPMKIAGALVTHGRLADAVVSIAGGVDAYAYGGRTDDVVVDQRGCLYEPRVVAAQVGQPVTFVNDDPIFHNVRSVSTSNETFSINMAAKNQRETKVFMKPEIVETRCDVHPWMVAHVAVVENPWFAVTKTDGAYILVGVPAGEIDVRVWSAAGGSETQRVIVPPAGEARVDFTLGLAK